MDSKTYHDHLDTIPSICSWLDIEDMVNNYLVNYLPDLDIETATKRVVSDLFLTSTLAIFTDKDNDAIRSEVKILLFEIAHVGSTSEATRYHYFAIYSKPDLNNFREDATIVPRLYPFICDISNSHFSVRERTLKQLTEKTGDYAHDNLRIISIRKQTEMSVWNEFLTIVSKNTAYGIMYIPGKLVSDDDTDFHEKFYIQRNNLDFPGYVAQRLTDDFSERFILTEEYEEFMKIRTEANADEYLQKSLMSLEEQVATVDKVIDIPKIEETTSPKWKQIQYDTHFIIASSDNKYLRDHFTKITDAFEKVREDAIISSDDDSIVEDFYLSVYRAFSHLDSIKSTCTDCKCGDKGTLVSSTVESTTKDISVNKDNKEIHIHIHL